MGKDVRLVIMEVVDQIWIDYWFKRDQVFNV